MIYFLSINILTLLLCIIDKEKAIKNKYADKFSNDLNDVWISEISSFNDQNSNLSEMDKIELIKKYHSLKESGIITEDEFEKKKHELLNM